MSHHSDDVTVRALRSFAGDEGWKTPSSEPFVVNRRRASDLKANGLVEILNEKSAPAHENKMAPEPENKADDKTAIKKK